MVSALYNYVLEKPDDYTSGSADKMKSIKQQAWSLLDKEYLKNTGLPGAVVKRDLNIDDLKNVYYKYLRAWYKKSIENSSDVTSEEKVLFKRSMTLLNKGATATNSGLFGLSKISWTVDEKMGNMVDAVIHKSANDPAKDDSGQVSSNLETMQSALRALVKDLTGKIGLTMSQDVIKKLKQKDSSKDKLANYRRLKRSIKEARDASIRRMTINGPLPADEVVDNLKNLGFTDIPIVSSKEGFDGLVGMDKGRMVLYTPEGSPLDAIIAPGSKIKKNPKYNPEMDDSYVYKYVAPNGVATNRVYTQKRAVTNTQSKFKRVDDNAGQVQSWLRTWRRDLFNPDVSKQIPATIAYLIYLTGARVGSSNTNRSATGGVQSYGISSILNKQVKLGSNKIIISYPGKKGMQQKHVIKITSDKYLKKLVEIIEEQKEVRKAGETLWSLPMQKGGVKAIGYSRVNSYVKSMGLQKIHALRHVRGNELVKQKLEGVPFKPTKKAAKNLALRQREAENYIKDKVLTPAANLLGHQSKTKAGIKPGWRTTISAYINPAIISNWFVDKQLEVPKWAVVKE